MPTVSLLAKHIHLPHEGVDKLPVVLLDPLLVVNIMPPAPLFPPNLEASQASGHQKEPRRDDPNKQYKQPDLNS